MKRTDLRVERADWLAQQLANAARDGRTRHTGLAGTTVLRDVEDVRWEDTVTGAEHSIREIPQSIIIAQERLDAAEQAIITVETGLETAQQRADDAWTDAQTAVDTATQALTSANSRNSVIRSTDPASGTTNPTTDLPNAAGDVWWQVDTGGSVIGQWIWDGDEWQDSPISHQTIASVDVNALTVSGTARLAEAVVDKIMSDAAYFGKLTVGGPDGVVQIAEGAVTAPMIYATSDLWTKMLTVAGDATIGGELIVPNSIYARHMAIVPGNLYPDPYFNEADAYTGIGISLVTDAGMPGGRALQIGTSTVQRGTYYRGAGARVIQLKPGASYRVRATLTLAGGAGGVTVFLRAGGVISFVPLTAPQGTSQVEGVIVAPPSDDGLYTLGFYGSEESGSLVEGGTIKVGGVELLPMSDASLIVDGSIYARHADLGSLATGMLESKELQIVMPGWELSRTNLCENSRMLRAGGWLRFSGRGAASYSGGLYAVYDHATAVGQWLAVLPDKPNLRPGGGKITVGTNMWSDEPNMPQGINLVAWNAAGGIVFDGYGSGGTAVRSVNTRTVSTFDVPGSAVTYELRFRNAAQSTMINRACAVSMVTIEQGDVFTDGSFFYGNMPETATRKYAYEGAWDASPSLLYTPKDGARLSFDADGITLSNPVGWGVSGSLGNPDGGQDHLRFGSTQVSGSGVQAPQVIADTIRLAGTDLSEQINALSPGVVARYSRSTNTNLRKSRSRILETDFRHKAGRQYRVEMDAMQVVVPGNAATTVIGELRSFTPPFTSWAATTLRRQYTGVNPAGSGAHVVPGLAASTGVSADTHLAWVVTVETPGAFSYVDASGSAIQLQVRDDGLVVPATGAAWMDPAESGSGGTGPVAPTQRYVKTYESTGVGSWWRSNGARDSMAKDAVQGSYDGSAGSARDGGWSFADMTADLAGSTIESIRLTAANVSWYFHGSGGTGQIHLHNGASVLGSKPGTTGYVGQIAGWPEASGQDIWVPSSFFDGFKNGTHKGFLMSAGDNYSGTHYGRFHPTAYITITYVK